jgi:uncharacterized Zn-binding protein involved in type VI secretion
MPGVGKVGMSKAGLGIILGPGAPTILVEGLPLSLLGDIVAPHGKPPHKIAKIITGSPTVKGFGKPITVELISVASCAHPVNTGAFTVKSL